jgi:hypothetical protein
MGPAIHMLRVSGVIVYFSLCLYCALLTYAHRHLYTYRLDADIFNEFNYCTYVRRVGMIRAGRLGIWIPIRGQFFLRIVQSNRGVRGSFHLKPLLRLSGSVPLLPLWSLIACAGQIYLIRGVTLYSLWEWLMSVFCYVLAARFLYIPTSGVQEFNSYG